MQQINELSDMLNQHFKWNKAESESRYQRMQHFLHDYPINFDVVAWFKSIFRYGLAWLQDKLQNAVDSLRTLLHFIVFKELF